MRHLETVDLSGNAMTDDSVSDMEAMIVNNKQLQKLCLPNCVFSQTSLRIIIQAMQTVASLQYVDFSTNKLDSEQLASDIGALADNRKLEQINFTKLILKENGYQHLKTHLIKLRGLKHLNITDCAFTNQEAVHLGTVIGSNYKIQEVIISNCKVTDHEVIALTDNIGIYDQLEHLELTNNSGVNPFIHNLLIFLSYSSKLKHTTLCNCQLQPNEIKQILMVLKYMRHLETVDLSGNAMTDDSVSDMEAMIINNKHLQKLCLPCCVLNQASLRIIIQAMQTISLLEYVDFSTNRFDSKLASDIAILVAKNTKLEALYFAKLEVNHCGFQYLKTCLVKIKGLTYFSITDCLFDDQSVANVVTALHNNPEIQEANLSNCEAFDNNMEKIIKQLKYLLSLRYLNLGHIAFGSQTEDEIIDMINNSSHLKVVDMVGCYLSTKMFSVRESIVFV